jgi:hypothetical protein
MPEAIIEIIYVEFYKMMQHSKCLVLGLALSEK